MLGRTPQNRLDMDVDYSYSRPLVNLLTQELNDILIEPPNNAGLVPPPPPPPAPPVIPPANGGGEEQDLSKGQKRRAETWVPEETQCLINLRRELHSHFNATKSNRHLWDHISLGMGERGWNRTGSMSVDKWRNLLKEFKKATNANRGTVGSKDVDYDKLDEYCRVKKIYAASKKSRSGPYFQIPGEDNGGPPFAETNAHFDTNLLNIPEQEGIVPDQFHQWNWSATPIQFEENIPRSGRRIITVRREECVRRVGMDGSPEAIREAIKSSFGLRTRRTFWLEDEDGIVHPIDSNMPPGEYTIHIDDGITVRICGSTNPNHTQCRIIEKTFYSDDVFLHFLRCCGWIALTNPRFCRVIESVDDLRRGELYHGVRRRQN